MRPVTILRTLIIIEIVSTLLGMYADIALEATFPPELRAYLLTQSQGAFGAKETLTAVILAAFLVALVVAWVGLWFMKRWARTLYTTLVVIGLVLTLFLGPVVTSAFAAALYSIATLAGGVMLGLLWLSELRVEFHALPNFPKQ
jgi:hypothetical protein